MTTSPQAGLIYEVTVTLPVAEFDRMAEYMRTKHIAQVLEHDAFSDAAFYVESIDLSSVPQASVRSFTTHYYITNNEQFELYKSGYGLSMREDFSRELGSVHATVTRRCLKLLDAIACG